MGDKNKQKTARVLFAVAVIAIVILAAYFSYRNIFSMKPGVYREFSNNRVSPGEIFTLKLHVKPNKGDTYYLIEESVPEGFEIIGENFKDNKIKIAEIMDVKERSYEYKIKAPDAKGEYSFSGMYGMNSVNGTVPIKGDLLVKVE